MEFCKIYIHGFFYHLKKITKYLNQYLIDIHISGTLSQSSWTFRFSSDEDWCWCNLERIKNIGYLSSIRGTSGAVKFYFLHLSHHVDSLILEDTPISFISRLSSTVLVLQRYWWWLNQITKKELQIYPSILLREHSQQPHLKTSIV